MTRLLDGRHHLERFTMEQAGEVDYLITWRDEFVRRVSLTPSGSTADQTGVLAEEPLSGQVGGCYQLQPVTERHRGLAWQRSRS